MMTLNPVENLSSSPQESCDDRYIAYRALWLKVIIRAIFDYVTYRDCSKLEKRKIAEQAYIWLFESSKVFNSFESVCAFLDISPEKIRQKALSMDKDQVAKIEHLERDGTCGGAVFSGKILPIFEDSNKEE